jgi:hypothetical protein
MWQQVVWAQMAKSLKQLQIPSCHWPGTIGAGASEVMAGRLGRAKEADTRPTYKPQDAEWAEVI